MSADEEKLHDISTLHLEIGEFSMVFDYFQEDTIARFYVPQSIEWEEIKILIQSKTGQSYTLNISKSAWENFKQAEDSFLKTHDRAKQ